MQIIKINNVSEYITAVMQIDKEPPKRSSYLTRELLFRGQSDERYELIPSLGRYEGGHGDLFPVERNLIETAKRKRPDIFSSDLGPLELLGLLQHYGIPTRLLDLTENALVALFFACNSCPEKNGEVFVFSNCTFDVATYPLDIAIADSYRFSRGSFYDLSLFFHDVIQQPYFLEQRSILDDETDEGGARLIENLCKKAIFVYASNRLDRQKIQRGRYILFPNKIENSTEEKPGWFVPRIDPMSKDDESIIGRITIPYSTKAKILAEMKILGIDRGMLFADSVDITCEEIKDTFFSTKDRFALPKGINLYEQMKDN